MLHSALSHVSQTAECNMLHRALSHLGQEPPFAKCHRSLCMQALITALQVLVSSCNVISRMFCTSSWRGASTLFRTSSSSSSLRCSFAEPSEG